MLSETDKVLTDMGNAYVKLIRQKLAKKQKFTSKSTGKQYTKKINNSGKLSKSWDFDVVDGELVITAASYAIDVSEGLPRNASWAHLINWINTKPYRFRNSLGQFVTKTNKKVDSFAQYLNKKIAKVGTDLPSSGKGYIEQTNLEIQGVFDKDLAEAVALDIANEIRNNQKDN